MMRPTLLAIAITQALSIPNGQAAKLQVYKSGEVGIGCTLRKAISAINNASVGVTGCINSGSAFGTNDQIEFSVPTVSLSSGQLNLEKSLIINGGGNGVKISGNGSSRLFYIDKAGTNVTFNKLTLSGGSTSGSGGAIYVLGSSVTLKLANSTISGNTAANGGAIRVHHSLVYLNNSTVSNNFATSRGGGVSVSPGTLNLSNSTVSGNSAVSSGGAIAVATGRAFIAKSTLSANGAYTGGAIESRGRSDVTLISSTISGNSAHIGGAIIAHNTSGVLLAGSTVSSNSATYIGGIYARDSSYIDLFNSIVANSGSADCAISAAPAKTRANVHNIIEDGSCATSALMTDPKLGPLADNGGPTKTHALLPNSPAIDAGESLACNQPSTKLDQRGEHRPAGVACDLGAFEFGAATSFFLLPLPGGKATVIGL